MVQEVTVSVANWDKWNPKRDQKSYSWLRLENDTLTCQDMFNIGPIGRLVWVYILCQASRRNGRPIGLKLEYVASQLETKVTEVYAAILALEKRALLVFTTPELHQHDTGTTPTDGRTNGRDETDERTDEESTSANAAAPLIPPAGSLVHTWNTNCGSLPSVERLSDKRTKAAKARLRENPDLAYWASVVQRIAASAFCNGSGGWVANFDWLVRPDTHVKVMEGNYDNRAPKSKAEALSEKNRAMLEAIDRGEL